MTSHPSRRREIARHSGERGFTLLELLAATVASLMVVLAALMLSRGANRLFSGESNVGASQFSLRLGVDRLRSDMERAGFMTSANAHLDPDVCPDPTIGTPRIGVQSILYEPAATATTLTTSTALGLGTDRIRLQANFATTDSYLVSFIDTSSSTYQIYLQRATGAVARLLSVGEVGTPLTAIATTFPAGGILRLTNLVGSSQFLIISGATVDTAGVPIISARVAPPITAAQGAVTKCGIPGGGAACMGCTVNPVSKVDYYLGSLKGVTTTSGGSFDWAYPAGTRKADTEKFDLIRRETDHDGGVSYTIVAEYVVDLEFSFSADVDTTGGEPNVVTFPFKDSKNLEYGGDVTISTTAKPQRIRSIRYRVATRAHLPDRSAAADDGGPGLLRYPLDPGEYARVRTIYGEISLINHVGLRW